MKKELAYYRISPSVVPADKTSKIKIRAIDERYSFKDGVAYTVTFLPISHPSRPFSEEYLVSEAKRSADAVTVTASNSVLELEYSFKGEQKWNISLCAENTEEDTEERGGFELRMYSLYDDLYKLRPYKGDLHTHTNRSDGFASPALTAASYRKAGYDFISITDHHAWGSAKIADKVFSELKTGFAVYEGEEVHSNHMGHLHIVNFDSKSSVNDRILNDREAVIRELEEIKNSSELDSVSDPLDIAWRIWTYREIKKSGGVAILPHVLWFIYGVEHISPEVIDYTFEHGLMDVYEIHGGVSHRENNLQALIWQDMRARGLKYPIVASTDSHESREYGEFDFAIAYTVALARDVHSVREAILGGRTVAVQSDPGQIPNISGELRLARYADFLIENYFPIHDEYAFSSGLMMQRYAMGDKKNAKLAAEIAEGYIKEYEEEFFVG